MCDTSLSSGFPLADLTKLKAFLQRSRRRAIALVLMEQALVASGAALAGFIFLLLLGTQILNWYWPAILFAGSFGWGLYRTLRKVPSEYRLAQQVDQRLDLRDSISTACYFADPVSNGQGSVSFRELVCRRADELCSGLTAESAVPIRASRRVWITAGLALAALGMFGVRYGVRGSLDLRPPLITSFGDYFSTALQIAGLRAPQMTKLLHRTGNAVKKETEYIPRPGDKPDPGGQSPKGMKSRPDGDQSSEQSNLLDRLMDAFKDLFQGVSTQDNPGPGKGKSAEGTTAKGKKGEESDPGQTPSDEQGTPGEGQESENQEAAQAVAASKSVQDVAPEDAEEEESGQEESERNGIGQGDGSMDIKDAARLNAMGKISEQYLLRQAKITGDMMVEVATDKQQDLLTPYSQSGAAHAEGGGQIHRDLVPLIYQGYVRQYFEEVRKSDAK